jgi:hypothetical protein
MEILKQTAMCVQAGVRYYYEGEGHLLCFG